MKKTLTWLNQRGQPARHWITLLSLVTSVAATNVRQQRIKELERRISALEKPDPVGLRAADAARARR